MGKIVKYGAVGDYGCEFLADTKEEVQKWIDDEVAGHGQSTEPLPDSYYSIHPYTQDELDNMVED